MHNNRGDIQRSLVRHTRWYAFSFSWRASFPHLHINTHILRWPRSNALTSRPVTSGQVVVFLDSRTPSTVRPSHHSLQQPAFQPLRCGIRPPRCPPMKHRTLIRALDELSIRIRGAAREHSKTTSRVLIGDAPCRRPPTESPSTCRGLCCPSLL